MSDTRTFRRHSVPGRLALCFLLLAIGSGCTTMYQLPSTYPEVVSGRINVGNDVIITGTNGQVLEMHVEEVSSSGLAGAGQHVAYGDMRTIAVRQFDGEKATNLIMGATLIVALPYALAGLGAAGGVN